MIIQFYTSLIRRSLLAVGEAGWRIVQNGKACPRIPLTGNRVFTPEAYKSFCQVQTSRHPALHFQNKNPAKAPSFLKKSIF